jgi:Fungal specific transcription factor domain
MFWCIYVLDKRFSFMVNLPFTLQDSEIEHVCPEYVSVLSRYIWF